MCETCAVLSQKIYQAQAEGNAEKARVLAVVRSNHWKLQHTAKHNVVAVAPDLIIWPNGERWVVRA